MCDNKLSPVVVSESSVRARWDEDSEEGNVVEEEEEEEEDVIEVHTHREGYIIFLRTIFTEIKCLFSRQNLKFKICFSLVLKILHSII